MARVLVSGATGRMGSALVKALLARNDAVRAVVRPGSAGRLPEGVEKAECDLSKAALPKAAFGGVHKVVHLAGLVGEHPYGELLLQNAFASKNLLAACPTNVQKVVMASSVSVYGEYKGKIVDESFAPKGESSYGRSKLSAETFSRPYCGELPIVFLRFGMVYGPGFEEGYFAVLRYLQQGRMRIIGGGSNRLPLLHIDDCVQAILLALDRQAPPCREYNIVGAEQTTQKELLALAASELGVPAPKGSVPAIAASAAAKLRFLSKGGGFSAENVRQLSMDRAYSTERAKAELGFEAKVKLRDGLKEVVRIYLEREGKNKEERAE